jgi:predicted RNase H-like nuclease (RuvC/YqgF family)
MENTSLLRRLVKLRVAQEAEIEDLKRQLQEAEADKYRLSRERDEIKDRYEAATKYWNPVYELLLTEKNELEKKLQEAQAKIDSLMLEYCPDEMTPEQIENWKRHQTGAKESK